MVKKLTKSGDSLVLVIDDALLDALGVDADTPLEVSTRTATCGPETGMAR